MLEIYDLKLCFKDAEKAPVSTKNLQHVWKYCGTVDTQRSTKQDYGLFHTQLTQMWKLPATQIWIDAYLRSEMCHPSTGVVSHVSDGGANANNVIK